MPVLCTIIMTEEEKKAKEQEEKEYAEDLMRYSMMGRAGYSCCETD